MASDPTMEQLLRAAPTGARTEDRIAALERRIRQLMQDQPIYGYVNSAGTRVWGDGFTSARTAAGRYTLTFSRSYKPYPMVVAMCDAAFVASMPAGYTPLPTEFKILTFNSATVAAADCGFFFVARQP